MVANVKQDPGREQRVDRLREQAAKLGSSVKEEARALKEQAADKALELARAAKDQAERFLGDQKDAAAKRIEKLGSVIHQAARVLDAGNVGKVASYVDMAATGVTDASTYLKESEVDDIAEDMAQVVRKHPLATLSAMMVAGLAVARFVKAAQPESESDDAYEERAAGRKRK